MWLTRIIAVFWAAENPNQCLKLPLHSSHGPIWCGFTATCILGPLFSKSSAPQVLWHALSPIIDTHPHWSNPWLPLLWKGDQFQQQCLCRRSSSTHSPLCETVGPLLYLWRRNHKSSFAYSLAFRLESLQLLAMGISQKHGLPWSHHISLRS